MTPRSNIDQSFDMIATPPPPSGQAAFSFRSIVDQFASIADIVISEERSLLSEHFVIVRP